MGNQTGINGIVDALIRFIKTIKKPMSLSSHEKNTKIKYGINGQTGLVGDNSKVEGDIHIHHGDTFYQTMSPLKDKRNLSEEIQDYCVKIETLHNEIIPAGFKTRLRIPILIEDIYVPLRALLDLRPTGHTCFGGSKDAEEHLQECGKVKEISLLEAFNEIRTINRNGIVILGDPGSGKTTHLKRLLLWCLRGGLSRLGLPEDMLPIFLPLRELKDLSADLSDFIQSRLNQRHLKTPDGFGERMSKRGNLLFLLDGLDEVADLGQRVEVSRWIEDALTVYPDCRFVVTCRFAGYTDNVQLNAHFLEMHIRPLDEKEAKKFIHNWYRIIETGLSSDKAQAKIIAEEAAENLIKRLQQPEFRARRVFELTRNPLLLTNLCLVHCDRGGSLPQGRAELYEECTDVLLELWRDRLWQEVILILLALEAPSHFKAFMSEIVKLSVFTKESALVEMCFDDSAEISIQPFIDLIKQSPGSDRELHRRQLAALKLIQRWDDSEIDRLITDIAHHPYDEIRKWLQQQSHRKRQAVIHADRGGYELVRIPAGSFMMGSEEHDWERPVHEVHISEFYLGGYPVTNEEYERFMAANPGMSEPKYWGDRQFNQPRQPVVGVSWDDAVKYAEWAGLQLPTEAQWEYACRACTTTRYYTGNTEEDLGRAGWYCDNSNGKLHPVGEKEPNPWGVYDMHGNVWEWCHDWFDENYYADSPSVDPTGPDTGASRVIRGGSWDRDAGLCRSADRYGLRPASRGNDLGFRLASLPDRRSYVAPDGDFISS